jgi:hypothetical protein
MATFTDIVKEQRSQGVGVFSSLGKAAGQRTLERIDPRNYLFNRKGLATALFPGLKGYQTKAGKETSKLSDSTSTLSSSQTDSITSKLDELKAVQQETAKNTFVLPSMARDMNVMRQNIIKLVKLNGGKPSNRADSFFLTAKQREDAYETKFGKKSPTQVKDEKDKDKKGGLLGLLSGALLFFKTLVSGIFTLFSGLIPSILNLFTGLIGTIGNIAGSLLGPAIRTVIGSLSGLFAPLLEVLTPLIAVIGTLLLAFKAINFLASKITGKPMDYYEKGKYDPKTTPEDVKKAYGGLGVGEQVISDKQYWNNKKALESDKPIAGFANGKPMQDVRPYLQKQNEAYEKVQEFKNSNDPLQQYRRDVEAGRTKLSFEDWKKAKETSPTPTSSKSFESNTPTSISTDSGTMAELIRTKFKEAGFNDVQAEAAVANAMAESGLNPNAQNSNGKEDSIGLFQMNRNGGLGEGHSVENLKDPNYNIDLAIAAAKKSKAFNEATTIDKAVAAFVNDVERPANADLEIEKRTQIALGQKPNMERGSVDSTLALAASHMPNINDMGKFLNQGSAEFENMIRDFMKSSGDTIINSDSSTKVSSSSSNKNGIPGSTFDVDFVPKLLSTRMA